MTKWMAAVLSLMIFWVQSAEVARSQGAGERSIYQSYRKPVPVPDFSLQNLQGETVQIENYRGKVILLNFWTTW